MGSGKNLVRMNFPLVFLPWFVSMAPLPVIGSAYSFPFLLRYSENGSQIHATKQTDLPGHHSARDTLPVQARTRQQAVSFSWWQVHRAAHGGRQGEISRQSRGMATAFHPSRAQSGEPEGGADSAGP